MPAYSSSCWKIFLAADILHVRMLILEVLDLDMKYGKVLHYMTSLIQHIQIFRHLSYVLSELLNTFSIALC